jgi:hypothetical protein
MSVLNGIRNILKNIEEEADSVYTINMVDVADNESLVNQGKWSSIESKHAMDQEIFRGHLEDSRLCQVT